MKLVQIGIGFALGCATMFAAATLLPAQDADSPPQEMTPQQMEQMWQQAMEKYCTPAEHHKELARRVGAWTLKGEYFEPSGEVSMTWDGTAQFEMILGGRYLMGHYFAEGEGMPQPFEGIGVTGWDRIKNEWQVGWVDNMSTAVMFQTGSGPADQMEFTGMMPEPMAGTYVKSRMIEKMISENKMVSEFYSPGQDGDMYMSMRLTFDRQATQPAPAER